MYFKSIISCVQFPYFPVAIETQAVYEVYYTAVTSHKLKILLVGQAMENTEPLANLANGFAIRQPS